ncbi:MAG: homocysteine S-methyltransferase family protein [Pseudomonadota bacterium]
MSEITLLDGGMGQELVRLAGGRATPLWATQALLDDPNQVVRVHQMYAAAGATMATTNTYAIHRDRLRGGASNHYASVDAEMPDIEDQFASLFQCAVEVALTVKDHGRIAGSIGPLGASYRADLLPDHDEAVALFAEAVELLAPNVDVLLFETVPSLAAAKAALEAGRRTDRPVWLAFTADDENGRLLRSGEPMSQAAQIAADADAALVNCSVPEVVPDGLDALAACGRPFGAYANGFTQITDAFMVGETTVSGLTARTDLSPEVYADHAMAWVGQGATIVGGCCEVGPAHISEIADRLRAAGHTLI